MNRIPAPADVARELNIAAGAEIVRVRRLRRSRGEPLALLTNHLPGNFRPTVADLTKGGLYNYLRAQGVHLRLAHQHIGARLAHDEEAQVLDEAPRSVLLTMRRTAFDDQGTAVECGQQIYRASRYAFETTLVCR